MLVAVAAVLGCAGDNEPDSGGGTGDEAAGGAGGTEPADFDACADHGAVGGEGWAAVPLADHPSLAQVGGGTTVDLGGHRLALGQPAEGCFVAVSRVCTHQGCDTAYDGGRFVCPCHGAVFDLDGTAVSGPTSVPVQSFLAAPGDDVVWVKVG